jgi:outer membrane lipoprotein SlyB
MERKHRFIPPLVAAAALSVVAFSGIGIAAITGHLPIARSALNPFAGLAYVIPSSHAEVAIEQLHQGLTRNAGESAVNGKPVNFRFGERVPARQSKCVNCGVVDSIAVQQPSSPDIQDFGSKAFADRNAREMGSNATSFVVTVKMENGTVRTIRENQRPSFSIGERVKLVNGAVIPQG